MKADYPNWLAEQKYSENTQSAQIHRVKKVEEAYGSLDERFENGTYQQLINELSYSRSDERANKANPTKIKFDGNIRNNLQSYKNAVVRYKKFLTDKEFRSVPYKEQEFLADSLADDISDEFGVQQKQRLSLERDMQAALRANIASLDLNLRIIDDGSERAVNSGLIDITCEDDEGIVVIELKAGTADSRAIGQILGYMGDLQEEEDKPVRGILIAHDFDQRVKSASRALQNVTLKKYSIEFKFEAAT